MHIPVTALHALYLALAFALALLAARPLAADADAQAVMRIGFGSCADQAVDQPIWDAVNRARPQAFVFLGDNIYADTQDIDVMRDKYAKLAAKPGFQALRHRSRVLATWDDHDYGDNDVGAAWPMKEESRRIFLDFWRIPADSPRRRRDGIHGDYTLGEAGRRVQVLLLDTRWNRTPERRAPKAEIEARRPAFMGPYAPTDDTDQTLLGEAQWAWLEEKLGEPAELRIIASSIPFVMEFTGWDTWVNYPDEKRRMLDLLAETRAEGVVFISGDTHRAEISRLDGVLPYPLWDITSSGLTKSWRGVPPNRHRVGRTFNDQHFGLINIVWSLPDPQISFEIRDVERRVQLSQVISLSSLRAAAETP